MKALCWYGKEDVRLETVDDPVIENDGDIIVRVTLCAICGSDIHLYDKYMPTMEKGDVLGHEGMGQVVEVGKSVTKFQKGDRVVIPFTISCGQCFFCKRGLYSACDNSNPSAEKAAKIMGQSPAGIYGYSHLLGGFRGSQAEYVRVPYADVGPIKVPDDLPDEKVLFLSDIFPTGYMAAENCGISEGDTVAIWGCGPVGQFAIQSAWMFGAGRVIAIDQVPERLGMARTYGKAETIDFANKDVYETLMEMTNGLGPDACIDAVGCEAHATGSLGAVYDKVKAAAVKGTNRIHVLREAIRCCRKAGTLSIPGVYTGLADKFPVGPLMNKGLTVRTGQTHVQRYLQPLLEKIQKGEIDPSFVITHRLRLEDGPNAYRMFRDKEDGCIKVVMKP